QTLAADGSAAAQVPESSEPELSGRSAKPQMGDRYLLYSNQTRCAVPVHDPGSVRQQHCSLQDCNPANSQPGSGYDPPGSAQRKEEGRRRVTAPQRPRVSVYFPSVL